jgi:UDP-glucose 4-epimerase
MKTIVTGGAGFIGSHVVDRLVKGGHEVTVIDNLCSGKLEFIKRHIDTRRIEFLKGDLLDKSFLGKAMKMDADIVFHIAANPEVRLGVVGVDPRRHLEQNVIATFNVLEEMRKNKMKRVVFTSTSAVYGEAKKIPTPEDSPTTPISLYGASKLACEAFITSYGYTFGIQSWVFRFANVVGPRGTHGILVDFTNKLRKNPKELEILGDGKQRKSYLYTEDCIDAMMFALKKSKERVNIFNIGSEDWIYVSKIAQIVVEEMKLKNVAFKYTGGDRGWVGDVPKMMLSIDKIKKLGWKPGFNSEQSVRNAVKHLVHD